MVQRGVRSERLELSLLIVDVTDWHKADVYIVRKSVRFRMANLRRLTARYSPALTPTRPKSPSRPLARPTNS